MTTTVANEMFMDEFWEILKKGEANGKGYDWIEPML
jgi:hypothetical protein